MSEHRVSNFNGGPSQLPFEVLQQAQAELLNVRGSGLSALEISHRGGVFDKIFAEAEADFRQLLNIPKNYKVLFFQTGATGQFAAVPLNLLGKSNQSPNYMVTGRWSEAAAEEAKLYTVPNYVACTVGAIANPSTWKVNEQAPYFYYCDNETINGVEFPFVPDVPNGVTLVSDMSSNILTRPVDVTKFGVIYAGAQKNAGTSGLTMVIVREDLLDREKVHPVPTVLHWKVW